ncbi:MAG: bifunctional nuclease family protein [Bacteroidia bacterium]|nr:bifunctional nuclease family protein [Bacteroidia bacterium]
MVKKELSIIALSKSNSSQGNFALILEEVNGDRRIPIIIGPFEAQAIAIALEKLEITRPLTHDLMLQILERGQTQLIEVVISELRDDVFIAELVINNNGIPERIDARSSDAIALAIRKPCKIYTYEAVLEEAGFTNDAVKALPKGVRPLEDYSVKELKNLLDEALEKEDYERAQKIKEVLNKK